MAEVKSKADILTQLEKTIKRAKVIRETLARQKEREIPLAESETIGKRDLEA